VYIITGNGPETSGKIGQEVDGFSMPAAAFARLVE
jgi:hypothetical protein